MGCHVIGKHLYVNWDDLNNMGAEIANNILNTINDIDIYDYVEMIGTTTMSTTPYFVDIMKILKNKRVYRLKLYNTILSSDDINGMFVDFFKNNTHMDELQLDVRSVGDMSSDVLNCSIKIHKLKLMLYNDNISQILLENLIRTKSTISDMAIHIYPNIGAPNKYLLSLIRELVDISNDIRRFSIDCFYDINPNESFMWNMIKIIQSLKKYDKFSMLGMLYNTDIIWYPDQFYLELSQLLDNSKIENLSINHIGKELVDSICRSKYLKRLNFKVCDPANIMKIIDNNNSITSIIGNLDRMNTTHNFMYKNTYLTYVSHQSLDSRLAHMMLEITYRNQRMDRKEIHIFLVNFTIIFRHLPSYIILWIFDWLPVLEYHPNVGFEKSVMYLIKEHKKMKVIESTLDSIRRLRRV